MRFRLLGIPVQIQPWFWLTSALLGLPALTSGHVAAFFLWIVAIFIAVVVHELGHAVAILRHGGRPDITLHALGGTTSWGGVAYLGRGQRAFISFAGPLAGFLLAALLLGVALLFPGLVTKVPPLVGSGLDTLFWVNVFLGAINLAPVLPFDGGHILEAALGPARADWTVGISQIAGAIITMGFLIMQATWGALLFGMSTFQSFQQHPGVLRRLWLKMRLRRLENESASIRRSVIRDAERRAGSPKLRIIQGGASEPKDRRDLN
ncbi:MAG: site-2 protease family protein [Byssovorax sp.]